ncbi:hypothetical protein GGF43_003526 [Coemansia sp. RSA 2618]|nr:hypothetical protein GGF43_003526 [Coemansia sp. RSA 2618]
MSAVEDSWVVVDKTSGGSLRAKASHESLYLSDDSDGAKPRVHVHGQTDNAVAPELLEWINNAARESSTALPLGANRNPSTSKASYRTNSSSAGSRQRRPRRSSVHATSEVSGLDLEHDADGFNEGMFVVKVLEVRQLGAQKPMNLQCTAQVNDERFVIPPVQSKPKGPQLWASKMNDTFVFDVSRQFTFNLGVYGTHPHPPRARPGSVLASRMLPRRQLNESTPSLASNSSTRTTAKIKRGFRKMFRNKSGGIDAIASDPAYAGTGDCGTMPSLAEDAALALGDDAAGLGLAYDGQGRHVEVQTHGASPQDPEPEVLCDTRPRGGSFAEFAQHPAISRLSSYLPRNRTSTTTSSHEINYSGPRLRAFSNASTISSTPQPLGELFLDLRVDRREKRRATFTLPVVNQDQVTMRGGAHVEMEVVLEYGIIVHETFEERAARVRREREASQRGQLHERQQRMEQQWAAIDEQDRMPRLRGFLSVFTRSGRVSTWKRYWAVLSCTRILFYDSEADELRSAAPVAKLSLFHLHDAGLPESDLVAIGPSGLELRLSPLAMTDRHRRKSAFPRKSAIASLDRARQLQHEAQQHPMPPIGQLSVSSDKSKRSDDMSLLLADEDDATLFKFSEWQCRVYILLDTLADRDLWLKELKNHSVPSCEFARFRLRQRRAWRSHEFESAAESLRQSGRQLDVVSARARDVLSAAHNESAKRVFAERITQKQLPQKPMYIESIKKPAEKPVFFEAIKKPANKFEHAKKPTGKPSLFEQIKMPGPASFDDDNDEEELEGATLTSIAAVDNNSGSERKKIVLVTNSRKPVAMAFGKPATFNLVVEPAVSSKPVAPPAKKRMRAVRRSSSVGDLRRTPESTLVQSSDESDNAPPLGRRDSGASTVIEVVGAAKEQRPGTVSRRFLFVWNINDI